MVDMFSAAGNGGARTGVGPGMNRSLVAALAGAFTVACAQGAVAADVTAAQTAAFVPGTTKYDDVIHVLGAPSSQTVSSDGSRVIGYSSTHSHIKAASFIPIVGLFAGGATADTSVTYLSFGPDGRLIQSSSSNANIDCSSNILAMGCSGAPAAMPSPNVVQTPTLAPPNSVVLGVSYGDLPPLTASMLGHPNLKAAMILTVAPGSVAERAGIKPGDCVTGYGARSVSSSADLSSAVRDTSPGQQVAVTVFRGGAITALTLTF